MDDFADATLLIADRATVFRYGLIELLKEQRPGWSSVQAAGFDDVLMHLRDTPTDLVLIELGLCGASRISGLTRLRQFFPEQKIVVLADDDDRMTILDCLAAGVNGYVLKSATVSQLLRAIETVLSGGVFAPAPLTGLPLAVPPARVLPEQELSPLMAHLTDRQIEVFRLLSEGCATKTIARRLGLAVGTVKVHLAAIYRVLGAHSRVEALAKARGGSPHPALSLVPAEYCN